ncbi:MAG: lipoyl(octanoyl) transferase LipB [Myxococcales bacterium]|nr:lipoyl(octanoyl) transferase LipB [Myxococcales bacterium]MDH5307772.1 lipoyl(octanoyl) transferase LipB [Myxococcales bacterium]MDH5566257.1 lipoyl(octanoyl) transferase LipB [Myxococcales bacterium]
MESLGCLPYEQALERQQQALVARRAGTAPDTLILLEHPPVVTLGRGADEAHLRLSRQALAARGIAVRDASRGGDVTYHGPGQLVGYPVLDLAARGERDAHRYLRDLEGVLCVALEQLGVTPRRVPGYTGVFVARASGAASARERKIASIGVGLRGWITYHGFALNVDVDLAGFASVVPCGLQDVEMTSIARELGAATPADLGRRARAAVTRAFLERWG